MIKTHSRAGNRGRTPPEDFILREKITHSHQERIPERIVDHADQQLTVISSHIKA